MDKSEKRIILALCAVVLALLGALVLRRSAPQEVVVNPFTPPPFEAAAVSGRPENVDKSIYGTLALSEGVTVSLYSTPVVSDGAAQVYFTAGEDNAAWVRLQLLDEAGALLGESGLLRPGEYVEYISLMTQPKKPGGIAKILTYEPETYYSMGSASAQIMLQFADQ